MENTMNNRNEIPQQVKQVVSIAETLLQGRYWECIYMALRQ